MKGLFGKICIVVFIGMLLQHSLVLYYDYQAQIEDRAVGEKDKKIEKKLGEIFYDKKEQLTTTSSLVEYVKETFQEDGYLAVMNSDKKIIYENLKDLHFPQYASMLVDCKENGFWSVKLENISEEYRKEIEEYIQSRSEDHEMVVQLSGQKKEYKEGSSTFTQIEPTFVKLDDKIIYGKESETVYRATLLGYSSHDYYRNYSKCEYGETKSIKREELESSMRDVAKKYAYSYDSNYSCDGNFSYSYKKVGNDLISCQSLNLDNIDNSELYVVFVQYHPFVFEGVFDKVGEDHFKEILFAVPIAIAVSGCVAFLIEKKKRVICKFDVISDCVKILRKVEDLSNKI